MTNCIFAPLLPYLLVLGDLNLTFMCVLPVHRGHYEHRGHLRRQGDHNLMVFVVTFGFVVAYLRCCGSLDMWWLIRYVVTLWICGGLLDVWCLMEDVMTHCRDVHCSVAHGTCGGSLDAGMC